MFFRLYWNDGDFFFSVIYLSLLYEEFSYLTDLIIGYNVITHEDHEHDKQYYNKHRAKQEWSGKISRILIFITHTSKDQEHRSYHGYSIKNAESKVRPRRKCLGFGIINRVLYAGFLIYFASPIFSHSFYLYKSF